MTNSRSTLLRRSGEAANRFRYPNRPRNHASTLPFKTLYQDLFEPLLDNKKPPGAPLARRKVGPKSVASQSPHEIRRHIIERYISRWRSEVGNDFYPAMRLILPEKDRDRAMYGLKEKVLAKYIIKILKIDKNSEDGYNLLNWKQPGQTAAARKAGDFPGRVYDVLAKRPFRTEPGNMTVEEVNDQLNMLSVAGKEEDQLPIIELFYREMNPDELKWLISIILRAMHIGATEKTFLQIWHPDAEVLFNISSSLKNVCWTLKDQSIRLKSDEDRGVALWQCFQPQLAQFQPKKMTQLVAKMRTTEDSPGFWIEEKLDGERMQMHVRTTTHDPNAEEEDKEKEGAVPSWKQFRFWSRKAKEYTYLYGSSFDDKEAALTRHLCDAFDPGMQNAIFDGEMITWDPEIDKMVPFGTLKTAALEQQSNPYSKGPRPLFRAFDILFLNGTDLTRYDLQSRRNALERTIRPVARRLEVLDYQIGTSWNDVEKALRKVVAEASEGLVVKDPKSRYRLNDRNDNWLKVKPEYMEEFGESLDCLVIGGYYGSGKRGGGLSSFLCGLRVDTERGEKSKKFYSFFKVGGGFTVNDYASIRHATDGKWIKWDPKKPPTEYIELGGGVQYQRERPDVWIKPEDSVVLQAKAASFTTSDEFAANLTLRFPRFTRFRSDKDWETALSVEDFYKLRASAENKQEESKEQARMQAASRKKPRLTDRSRKPLQVAGYSQKSLNAAQQQKDKDKTTTVFDGLTFYVMSEEKSKKMSKLEIEKLVKANGGSVIQTAEPKPGHDGTPAPAVICVSAKRTVHAASVLKKGHMPIFTPTYIFDSIEQAKFDAAYGLDQVPLRPEFPRHVFYAPEDLQEIYEQEVDEFGDSYGRNTTIEQLRQCLDAMKDFDTSLDGRLQDLAADMPGCIFHNTVLWFHTPQDDRVQSRSIEEAQDIAAFAGALLAQSLNDDSTTHVVVDKDNIGQAELKRMRGQLAKKKRLPRVVTLDWVKESWKEKTRLDEGRFAPL